MTIITRIDPPRSADEITMLRGFLDYFRATLRRQASGLDTDQLATRLAPSPMTVGGIVKHLACVEHWWFEMVLHGREEGDIWAEADWEADRDWDWHSAAQDTPEELDELLARHVRASDAALDEALANGGLDRAAVLPGPDGSTTSLRWIMVHMIEEYARHCGHADLIRESIDGATAL